MEYFARTTAGLERLALLDAQTQFALSAPALARRRLDFTTAVHPATLLRWRSVDDVYVALGQCAELAPGRAALDQLEAFAAALDLSTACATITQVRDLPDQPTLYVTASVASQRFSRHEVEERVRRAMAARGWQLADESHAAALDLRVLVEGAEALVGLRLAATPLHRRAYKVCHTPGSLKPPVAYALALLATLAPAATVLDPCCGAGTIALEAAALVPPAQVWASDVDPAVVACAEQNRQQAEAALHLSCAAATHLALPAASFDAVITNPPWGRQVLEPAALAELYRGLLTEIERLLKPQGRAVILTDQSELLLSIMLESTGLQLAYAQQISLFGLFPTIHVCVNGEIDPAAPFPPTPLGQALNTHVAQAGMWHSYVPL